MNSCLLEVREEPQTYQTLSRKNFPTVYTFPEHKIQLVNAFEMYQMLGIKMDFIDWFSEQAEEYGFEEEVDFVLMEEGCFVYLSMAMTLCALDKSHVGKQIRLNFLAIDHQRNSGGLLIK